MTTREDTEFVWQGVLNPGELHAHVALAQNKLADAAKAGQWSTVLRLLDEAGDVVNVNGWRPGGTAWFTPLHQVAWYGAPVTVAAELVARGALRSLTDARGRTPHDVRLARDAKERAKKGIAALSHPGRHLALRSFLTPPASPLSTTQAQALDTHLAALIDSRVAGVLYDGRNPRTVLRYPPVAILHEVPGQRLWFPVPGMFGGFAIELRQGYLDVKSWCRVVGGSGQAHVITEAGAELVDSGFV